MEEQEKSVALPEQAAAHLGADVGFEQALANPDSRRRFWVVDDDGTLEAMLEAPLEKWRVFLHPSQRRLVERHWNGPVRVLGGAGTGKTMVAMHRAKWLAEHLGEISGRVLWRRRTSRRTCASCARWRPWAGSGWPRWTGSLPIISSGTATPTTSCSTTTRGWKRPGRRRSPRRTTGWGSPTGSSATSGARSSRPRASPPRRTMAGRRAAAAAKH